MKLPGDFPSEFGGRYRMLDSYRLKAPDYIKENVTERVEQALPYFPEIIGYTVSIGVVKDSEGYIRDRPYAEADPWNHIIFLQPDADVSMVTIFHELAHLAIYKLHWTDNDVPHTSEKFCSIFAVSRMPSGWVDRDEIQYLGEPSIPKIHWPDACQQALDYREDRGAGSHYIKHCKELLGIE